MRPTFKSGLGQGLAQDPSQACRFRNFFLGPIPELCCASCSSHFQEIPQIMSTPLTRRNLLHFQGTQQIMSTRTQTWHSWRRNATYFVGSAGSTLFEQFPGNAANFVQKKVPEWSSEKGSGIGRPGWEVQASSCLSRPCFSRDEISKLGPKHQKWSEMGTESTVRAENRST